jgi:hypothetical protein
MKSDAQACRFGAVDNLIGYVCVHAFCSTTTVSKISPLVEGVCAMAMPASATRQILMIRTNCSADASTTLVGISAKLVVQDLCRNHGNQPL